MKQLKLCLITHNILPFDSYKKILLEAIKGGITSLQLRAKHLNRNELFNFSKQIQKVLKPFKIPLIINDHIELALAINADGLHLGQTDISPVLARKKLGEGKIIGLSIESFEQLEKANSLKEINYIAASSVFKCPTKKDINKIWGLECLKKLCANSKHPVIAIGGIDINNANNVMQTGAYGLAVISAINQANNRTSATKKLLEIIEINHRNNYVK